MYKGIYIMYMQYSPTIKRRDPSFPSNSRRMLGYRLDIAVNVEFEIAVYYCYIYIYDIYHKNEKG